MERAAAACASAAAAARGAPAAPLNPVRPPPPAWSAAMCMDAGGARPQDAFAPRVDNSRGAPHAFPPAPWLPGGGWPAPAPGGGQRHPLSEALDRLRYQEWQLEEPAERPPKVREGGGGGRSPHPNHAHRPHPSLLSPWTPPR